MLLLLQLGAGLLAVAVLLLAAPVELRIQVRGARPLRGQLAVRGLFGLWRQRVSVPASGSQRSDRPFRAAHAMPAPAVAKRSGGMPALRAVWRDPVLRRKALTRLQTLLTSLQWRELRLHVRLGLDDPADTGRLWALVGPLGAALASRGTADLAFEPVFDEAVLDVQAHARLVLVPLRLLGSLAVLAVIVVLAMARGTPAVPKRSR